VEYPLQELDVVLGEPFACVNSGLDRERSRQAEPLQSFEQYLKRAGIFAFGHGRFSSSAAEFDEYHAKGWQWPHVKVTRDSRLV
jgi:hypothetical protein